MAVVAPIAWAELPDTKPAAKSANRSPSIFSAALSRKLGFSAKKDSKEPKQEPVITIKLHADAREPLERMSSKSSTASTRSASPCSVAPSLPGSVDYEQDSGSRSRSSSVSAGSRSSSKASISSSFTADAQEVQRIARMINEEARSRCAVDRYRPVRDAFMAVDTDQDGQISAAECTAFFQHFGMTEDIAVRFHILMDRTGTGRADWREFMAMFAPVFQKKDILSEPPTYDEAYRTWRRCPAVNGQHWYFS